MGWPLSQDYNETIQSPASNFADPDLKRGEAVVNALGIPMPYSGNFADVYQVRCPDGSRWAVKCFTRQAEGLRERYQEISKHLRQAKLPFMVDFTYLEKGIRVAGTWYPVLKMQWVEGLTLNQFVGKYADNPAMLEALLQIWGRMAKQLRAAAVGHCDLQHGNVLLAPGASANSVALKLIDYDGMWVPALARKKSGEVGHACYQHPQRLREQSYNIDVDRFPLLLIATALRALKASGKGLWDRYDNGDNLLFKEADLVAPLQSHLFLDLTKTGDTLVSELMDILVKALRGRLETVPLLEKVMPETRPAPAAAAVAPMAAPTADRTFAFDETASTAPGPRAKRAGSSASHQPVREPRPAAKPVSSNQTAKVRTAPKAEEGPWYAEEVETPAARPARREKQKKQTRGSVMKWLVGGAVAVVVLAGIGIALWAFSRNPAPPQPPIPPIAIKDAGGQPNHNPSTPPDNAPQTKTDPKTPQKVPGKEPPGTDTPPDKPMEIENLGGTVWEGNAGPLADVIFRFEPGGVLACSYNSHPIYEGTWKQTDNALYFEMNNKDLECQASIRGERIEGDTWNTNAGKWKTALQRTMWASIAYSKSTAAYGYATNRKTEEEAKKDALAQVNATDVVSVQTFDVGWAALVVGKGDNYDVVTAGDEPTLTTSAVETAKKKGVEEGRIVLVLQCMGYMRMKEDFGAGDHYVAIAMSYKNPPPGWGSNYDTDFGSQEEAVKRAVKNAGGDNDAKMQCTKNGWVALAEGPGSAGWALGVTEDDAKNSAIASVSKITKNPCVVVAISSDGSFVRWPDGPISGHGIVKNPPPPPLAANAVTKENFDKIDKGMTKQDLVGLLGPPSETRGTDMDGGFTWKGRFGTVTVGITGGKASDKSNDQNWPVVWPGDAAPLPQEGFAGEWVNANKDPRGLARLAISKKGDAWSIEAWGAGGGGAPEIPWKKVGLSFRVDKVGAKSLPYGLATWDHGFAVEDLTLRAEKEELVVEMSITYKDESGRPNQRFVEKFKKKEPGGAAKPPTDDAWLQQVAALPAEKQVEAVSAKLKELNVGFDGKVTPTIEKGVVVGLEFVTDEVTDIAPVRALVGLRMLTCGSHTGKGRLADLSPLKGMPLLRLMCYGTQVSDLSPLKDMKLTDFNCNSTQVSDLSPLKDMKLTFLDCTGTKVPDLSPLKGMPLTFVGCGANVSDLSPLKDMKLTRLWCEGTKVSDLLPVKGMQLTELLCDGCPVSDLSPLKGMPLTFLVCYNTNVSDLSPLKGMPLTALNCQNAKVSDLSPLKGMPLKNLRCDFDPKSDAEILRSIKSLETINGKPAKDFWKDVDAK